MTLAEARQVLINFEHALSESRKPGEPASSIEEAVHLFVIAHDSHARFSSLVTRAITSMQAVQASITEEAKVPS